MVLSEAALKHSQSDTFISISICHSACATDFSSPPLSQALRMSTKAMKEKECQKPGWRLTFFDHLSLNFFSWEPFFRTHSGFPLSSGVGSLQFVLNSLYTGVLGKALQIQELLTFKAFITQIYWRKYSLKLSAKWSQLFFYPRSCSLTPKISSPKNTVKSVGM